MACSHWKRSQFWEGSVLGNTGTWEPVRQCSLRRFSRIPKRESHHRPARSATMEHGETFPTFAQQVALWRQVGDLDPASKNSALFSQIDTVAQEVCMAVGSDVTAGRDRVQKISELLRNYFAPKAAKSVYLQVVPSLQVRRAAQTMRRKTESKMQIGRPFPEISASTCCLRTAAPPAPPVPRNRWALPAYRDIRGSLLLPDRCVVPLDRVVVLLDRMLRRRRIWIRIRMKIMVSLRI